jgi:hypothetical protein
LLCVVIKSTFVWVPDDEINVIDFEGGNRVIYSNPKFMKRAAIFSSLPGAPGRSVPLVGFDNQPPSPSAR